MTDTYNVFLSWSGDRSRQVAAHLRDWLPLVVQSIRPWMSDDDIGKGSRSLEEIADALNSVKAGIICLTPESLSSPWLLFEAGALSRTFRDKANVCTFLIGGLKPTEVKAPLGQFQATIAEKEDMRRLVAKLNDLIQVPPLPEKALDRIFERMWVDLEKDLESLPSAPAEAPARRLVEDIMEEILGLVRNQSDSLNAIRRDTAATYAQMVPYCTPHLDLSDPWSLVQRTFPAGFPSESQGQLLRKLEILDYLKSKSGQQQPPTVLPPVPGAVDSTENPT